MSWRDWFKWGAYAFFALALCYLGESFFWRAPFLENLWLVCLISSGIFAAAALSEMPAPIWTGASLHLPRKDD